MAVTKTVTGKPQPDEPPPPTQLPLYEMSSQFRNWRYSAASLAKAREDLNASAVNRVQSMLQEERESGSTADGLNLAPSEIQYLTVKDEQSLVAYYLAQIVRLCKAFKFPNNVESTAMTYLKRFYLRNTCMDYHPKNVMLTCLFLSTKTENHTITIGNFASKIPNCTNEDVLGLEFLVSQSLKFQFKVHHAYLAGRGIALDLQSLIEDDSELNDFVDVVIPKALATINLLRLTDAEFLYTPSQIASAAFHLHSPTLTEKWVLSKSERRDSSTLRKSTAESSPNQEAIRLLEGFKSQIINPVLDMVELSKTVVDIESVREVDKRLKYCKNPEKDPNSALFKKRKAEKEFEAQEKKAKKDDARKDAELANNPFA